MAVSAIMKTAEPEIAMPASSDAFIGLVLLHPSVPQYIVTYPILKHNIVRFHQKSKVSGSLPKKPFRSPGG